MKIVKIGFINGLGKTKGCEKAPDAVIAKLKDVWSKENADAREFDISEIKVNNSNVEESEKKIFNGAAKEFSANEKMIFLGGDHSVSFNLVNAFNSKFKKAGLIVLDAHADCMEPMKEPTHEEWLRAVIEKGFDPKNIILIGLRNVYPTEMEFLKQKKINCFWMNELFSEFEKSCDMITEQARKFENLYISIDIDAADPAFAPGTGFIEPGGLSSREIVYLINRMSLLKNIKAADVVEVNPEKDINDMTVRLAAKIITELS
jgi:agmatinase